jgi:hypothetical protein
MAEEVRPDSTVSVSSSPVRRNQDRGRRLEHCDDCARLSQTGTVDS